ncbi:MAG: thioesterase family protein [Myxococcota bacterium]
MTDLPDAFYERKDDEFIPTALTIGPWDTSLQHGGPPSALLGGALQRHGESEEFFLARVTVEMIRPMPLEPMAVEVEIVREGKQVEWLQASLTVKGKEVARASAIRIRTSEVVLEHPNAEPATPPPSPDGVDTFQFPFFSTDIAYHRGVEMRVVDGQWPKGPMTTWMRPVRPLVFGRESTGWERLLIVADASNGLAPALPITRFTFINPDLTVYLNREPDGEWLGLSARSVPQPTGVGLVQSVLFDATGETGRSAQSLLIRPRG